jgi:hypothetical protein
MSRAKAAQRVAASNVAASLATLLSPARAAASRRNGAKSRGPRTAEGKARSARNALKHGLCAQRFVVLGDEDLAEFDALEAALTAELAPQGALQAVLARRIVAATWRLERAERMEGELFAQNIRGTTSFGLAMIRDCNGRQGRVGERGPNPFRPWRRAFDTLLRYRGGTLAELWRALRTLKALQAGAAQVEPTVTAAPRALPEPREIPIEPERRRNPEIASCATGPSAAPEPVAATPTSVEAGRPASVPCPRPETGVEPPIKPDSRGKACLRAAPSDAIASGSMLQPRATDEDRDLQHQQCRPPAAEPARMAARGEAGCRLPAGA